MIVEFFEDINIFLIGMVVEGCFWCDLFRSMWNLLYKELRDKFIVVFGDVVWKRVWNLLRFNSDLVIFGFFLGIIFKVNSFIFLLGV